MVCKDRDDSQGPASPEDDRAWHEALKGVTPMRHDRHVAASSLPPARARLRERDECAALDESLHGPIDLDWRLEGGEEPRFARPGVRASVLRDLRRGRWFAEAAIDLHGLNRAEALDALKTFLATAERKRQRCLRVIHGKGLGSPGNEPVLKKLTLAWLARQPAVLAFCQARVVDGGSGALIVLLRAQTAPPADACADR
ncbi:MAG: Endonuclease MutS2 [Rhodocyclaceae bacterium]|jgi:DNA-nicking Smr family endonuclease|nr:Smr/MutS family protein [Rhodocyclaceae bacterium]MCG3187062.1 Endonuclease MutS2 [Rhodocyclaceae bacterium]